MLVVSWISDCQDSDDDSSFSSYLQPPSKKKKVASVKNKSSLEEVEIKMMEGVTKALNDVPSNKTPAEESAEDIFGRMVATELKALKTFSRFRLKHDINNLIFKYQEKEFLDNQCPTNNNFVNISNQGTSTSSQMQFPTNTGVWYEALNNAMQN